VTERQYLTVVSFARPQVREPTLSVMPRDQPEAGLRGIGTRRVHWGSTDLK